MKDNNIRLGSTVTWLSGVAWRPDAENALPSHRVQRDKIIDREDK